MKITNKKWATAFGVTERTIREWRTRGYAVENCRTMADWLSNSEKVDIIAKAKAILILREEARLIALSVSSKDPSILRIAAESPNYSAESSFFICALAHLRLMQEAGEKVGGVTVDPRR